jgi:hypothetical protein
MECKYKGDGPVSANYAKGGKIFTTRSRFLKTPDVFRDGVTRKDYAAKKGKGGTLSKLEGDKSLPAVKPRDYGRLMLVAAISRLRRTYEVLDRYLAPLAAARSRQAPRSAGPRPQRHRDSNARS